MKQVMTKAIITIVNVTPCVGVWIETRALVLPVAQSMVTPCVGVWIETRLKFYMMM